MGRRRWDWCFALLMVLAVTPGAVAADPGHGPLAKGQAVRGWTILSRSEPDAMAMIAAARRYDINHLELSHEIVMNLRELSDPKLLGLVNRLTDAAHDAGIQEVVLWDHCLYGLSYYPDRFRTGPGKTIDLDDPAFWQWLRQDYRRMLDRVPHVDGLVLTFIETGARVEQQHSTKLTTAQEKLAAVIDAVADVVVSERHLNLYLRSFSYTQKEYQTVIGALRRVKDPGVRLMMKETPHDFLLTHPNDLYAGTLDRPTIIEFDLGNEFNGQGEIANTWPQHVLARARDLMARPHVIGYVARTDRFGSTRAVGKPSEINLWALKRYVEDHAISADRIYDEFITARYGAAALPQVKAAFQKSYDIITSSLYTLGTSTANHSSLEWEPYKSSYGRHVSGKWIDPPVVFVKHGVNREMHYWKDTIQHIAPAQLKRADGPLRIEAPWVLEKGWVTPDERMDEPFLAIILTEKDYGVRLAEAALNDIEQGKPGLSREDYDDLHACFERTLLTVRLYRATAKAYFGYRIWARGAGFQTETLKATITDGLHEMREVAKQIQAYEPKPAKGQWSWAGDADRAERLYRLITNGWGEYGGVAFPIDR